MVSLGAFLWMVSVHFPVTARSRRTSVCRVSTTRPPTARVIGTCLTAVRAVARAEIGLAVPGEVQLSVVRAQYLLRTRLRGVEGFLAAGDHQG